MDKIRVSVDADLKPLIPGFIDNRHKDVAALKSALANGANNDIQSIGHTLKGVGGGYGFERISAIGAELEAAAQQADADVMASLIAALETYLSQVEVVYE